MDERREEAKVETPSDQAQELTCPRCGYDQSGEIARWTDSCPVEGLCTECGLRFGWFDVYFPTRRLAATFENAERRLARAWVRTVHDSIATPRLFKRLKMHHPIAVGRLMVYAAILCAVPSLLNLVCTLNADVLNVAWGWFLIDFGWGGPHRTMYVESIVQKYIPWSIKRDPFLERIVLALVPVIEPSMATRRDHTLYPVDGVLFIAMWFLFTPLCFPILRQTLRRVRVRVAHIGRLGVYAATGLVLAVSLQILLDWLIQSDESQYFSGNGEILSQLSENSRLAVGLCAVWQIWFWSWAGHRYLRLPRAVPIAIAMTLVGGLASLAVVTSIFGWRILHAIPL